MYYKKRFHVFIIGIYLLIYNIINYRYKQNTVDLLTKWTTFRFENLSDNIY